MAKHSRFIFGFAAALFAASPAARADDAALKVLDYAWTDGITHRMCQQRFVTRAPRRPLYLWTRIAGSAAELAVLRDKGKLPIYHQWFHKDVGVVESADPDAVLQTPASEAIELGIGGAAFVEPLRREVADRGFFDWRTWSMKDHITRGRWEVRLVYATDDAVRCGDRDCVYQIDVP